MEYLPEQECVIGLGDENRLDLQVRLYPRHHFSAASQIVRSVESRDTLIVCRLLAACRRQRSLWLQLPDASERVTAHDGREQVLRNLVAVGRALRELHCQSVPGLPWSTTAASQHLHQLQAQQGARLLPRRAAWIERLHQQLQNELAQLAPRIVSCQGNVRWNRICVAGGQVAFLDYNQACYDHPMSDLGSLLADHLIELGCQEPLPGQVDAAEAQAALCAGYQPPYSNTDQLLERFTARALWRRLTEPFDENLCQWPRHIEARLAQVQSLLNTAHPTQRPRNRCGLPLNCRQPGKRPE